MALERRCCALLAITSILCGFANAGSYRPKPEIGHPAGLIPECPGIMKNASIASKRLSLLQIVTHTVTDNGNILRTYSPITATPKMIVKNRNVDLKRKKTVFYAIGFFDTSSLITNQALGAAYARRGYNVFISETFDFLTYIYPKSARLTRTIGKKIGEFLVKLTELGLKAEDLELVGMSLGAHVVSYAAKHFFKATGQKPSRITGLDPAGPCFRALPGKYRLDPSDALKVDVIHTNIDGFGMAERLGHIDYYVNGGEFQPGDIMYIPCLVICSHVKALIYWWQAIENPRKFIAIQCDSIQDARDANCYNGTEINYVGRDAMFDKPGVYYLPTSNEFPYFRGKEGLKEENEIYKSSVNIINSDNGFEA